MCGDSCSLEPDHKESYYHNRMMVHQHLLHLQYIQVTYLHTMQYVLQMDWSWGDHWLLLEEVLAQQRQALVCAPA